MIQPNALDLANGRPIRHIAWSEFKAEIMPEFSPPNCSQGHTSRFHMVCRTLEAMGVESTADLNNAMVDMYIAGRPTGQSDWTLSSLLIIIRTICNKAVSLRYLEVSPFKVRPISKLVRLGKPKGKRHLTRAEITRLMEVLRADIANTKGWSQWKARRLYIVVCLGLYCGLRKNELLRLHVADIDLPSRLIKLIPHNSTGKFKTESSAQPVPIAEALVPILEAWLAHRLDHPAGMPIDTTCPWLVPTCNRKAPWVSGATGTKVLDRLKAVAKRAGIAYVTMHMLRRSCATHLEAMGVPRSMVSRILRHSSEQVTEDFYLRRDEQNMVDAVKGLTF
jgi:integrase